MKCRRSQAALLATGLFLATTLCAVTVAPAATSRGVRRNPDADMAPNYRLPPTAPALGTAHSERG